MKLRNYSISFENDPDIFFDEAVFLNAGGYVYEVPYLLWQGHLYAFPVQIAQYGLSLCNRFYEGETMLLSKIKTIADFCLNNAVEDDNGNIYWNMLIERPKYSLKPPWKSAMANGEMISFLLRASEIVNNKDCKEITHLALNTMLIDIDSGGVLGKFPDGNPALQEYPSEPHSNVLNGMIFAIFGIKDYCDFFEKKIDPLNEIIEAIAENLHLYDTGIWSKYDLYKGGSTSSVIYHWLHIKQLKILEDFYPKKASTFKKFANKWQRYYNSSYMRFMRNLCRAREIYL